MITLILTKAEADHADWALDPMRDHASDDPEESRYPEAAVPTLASDNTHRFKRSVLTFPVPEDRSVPLDMLYRLEVQLVEMAQQAGERCPRGAKSLAQKIRAAFTVTEDESRAIVRGEV